MGKLKREYDIANVISQFTTLRREGEHWLRSVDHSSLVIDTSTNRFFWTSRGVNGDSAGDILDFYAAYYGVSREKAMRLSKDAPKSIVATVEQKKKDHPHLRWDLAAEHHSNLNDDGYAFWENRGVSIEAVESLLLGMMVDKSGDAWATIPIPSEDYSYLANYKLRRMGEGKPRYRQFMGDLEPVLYVPFPGIIKDRIVVVGGEIKAIVLGQYGIPAVSSSTGASTWLPRWNRLVFGKDVIVCLDPKEHLKGNPSYVAGKVVSGIKGAKSVIEKPLPYDPDDAIVLHGWHPSKVMEFLYG